MVETKRTTSVEELAETYSSIDKSTPKGLATFQAEYFKKANPKLSSNFRTLADNYDQLLEVAAGKFIIIINGEIVAKKQRTGGKTQMGWKTFNTSKEAQAYVSAEKLTNYKTTMLITPILREVNWRRKFKEEPKAEGPISYLKEATRRKKARNF